MQNYHTQKFFLLEIFLKMQESCTQPKFPWGMTIRQLVVKGGEQSAGLPRNLENLEKSGNLIFDQNVREKSGNFSILSEILEK